MSFENLKDVNESLKDMGFDCAYTFFKYPWLEFRHIEQVHLFRSERDQGIDELDWIPKGKVSSIKFMSEIVSARFIDNLDVFQCNCNTSDGDDCCFVDWEDRRFSVRTLDFLCKEIEHAGRHDKFETLPIFYALPQRH